MSAQPRPLLARRATRSGALRRAARCLALATLTLAAPVVASCGARPATGETAAVRFTIEPSEARVYTDERFLGGARVLATRPIQLRAGPRRFTITAEGYFPHDLDVELPPGTTTIRVRLRPVPP